MSERNRLPNKRRNQTFSFEHATGSAVQRYHATVGYFDNGEPGELFINSSQKAGSEADINASDAAVAVSLALQYGCPVEIIRTALRRNTNGSPMGPLAHALDLMVEKE